MDLKNYLILSADTPVARWENGELTVLNESLLPLFLRRDRNADMWLGTRAIDSRRPNSRLLKKALRLREKDDVSTAMHVNGAKITDNYWVKSSGSRLIYSDVRFSDDYFARLALRGTYDSFSRTGGEKHSRSPELTNTGSFEKCWRLVKGRWWMYKSADHGEMFSELFIARFGAALGINMAVYERGNRCVMTPDFTEGARCNFEPASSFMGDDDDYADVIGKLCEICPQAVPDYIRMIFLDTVCANPDRHTANFGLLRDTETGKLLGLAPVFDHNMALISRGYPKAPVRSDLLIRLFCDVLSGHPEYEGYMPEIKEETVRETIAGLHMRVRTNDIVDLIMKRYAMIRSEIALLSE
jgi:hypothetical protein